jgi:hypothetical protein
MIGRTGISEGFSFLLPRLADRLGNGQRQFFFQLFDLRIFDFRFAGLASC